MIDSMVISISDLLKKNLSSDPWTWQVKCHSISVVTLYALIATRTYPEVRSHRLHQTPASARSSLLRFAASSVFSTCQTVKWLTWNHSLVFKVNETLYPRHFDHLAKESEVQFFTRPHPADLLYPHALMFSSLRYPVVSAKQAWWAQKGA